LGGRGKKFQRTRGDSSILPLWTPLLSPSPERKAPEKTEAREFRSEREWAQNDRNPMKPDLSCGSRLSRAHSGRAWSRRGRPRATRGGLAKALSRSSPPPSTRLLHSKRYRSSPRTIRLTPPRKHPTAFVRSRPGLAEIRRWGGSFAPRIGSAVRPEPPFPFCFGGQDDSDLPEGRASSASRKLSSNHGSTRTRRAR